MSYPAGQANTSVKQSLLNDSADLSTRLRNVRQRLIDLGNTLHGPEPRDASAKMDAPEPAPTLHRNIGAAHRLLDDIEGELTRVESRL